MVETFQPTESPRSDSRRGGGGEACLRICGTVVFSGGCDAEVRSPGLGCRLACPRGPPAGRAAPSFAVTVPVFCGGYL